MISVICFSKDRPMQLEAYIQSLMHFGGINQKMISVITSETSPVNYELIRSHFPDIKWIAEQDFHNDLLKILECSESYILFGCDDVIYKNYFDPSQCIQIMQKDREVFGFSLRLGENVKFIPRIEESDGVLKWQWANSKAEYWNYPWEVSATLYRRDQVLNLLRHRPDLSNPNRLEAYIARQITRREICVPAKLACFPKSCAMTITVNRVQDEFPNEFDTAKPTDPSTLYGEYLSGVRQDWPKLLMYKNLSVHVGAEAFHLTDMVDPPKQRYTLLTGKERPRKRRWGLTAKFFYWQILTIAWEAVRKTLPRPMLMVLKSYIRRLQ